MTARSDREATVLPGLKSSYDVTGSIEAKLDEVTRGENRRVAVVADEDQPLVKAAEVAVAPWAVQCDPPLEHRPRDVQASGDDTETLAGVLRTDIDDDAVGRASGEGL